MKTRYAEFAILIITTISHPDKQSKRNFEVFLTAYLAVQEGVMNKMTIFFYFAYVVFK